MLRHRQSFNRITFNWITFAPLAFLMLWANGFIFLKMGLEYTDPFTFLALRYIIVVAILAILVLWLRPSFPTKLNEWIPLIGVGLFLQTGYFAFTYLSLHAGLSASTVALITCQQPILIGLLSPFFTSDKMTYGRWLGLIFGVIGACIVITSNSHQSALSLSGVLFGVFALLSITCSTLIEKRYSASTNLVAANFVQYSVALIVIAPLAYALEPMKVEWTGELFLALTYLVFGASLFAISLLLAMIRRNEASRVSALFFLVPPTTALIAFFFLGESLSLQSLVGITLTALGIYIVMRRGS